MVTKAQLANLIEDLLLRHRLDEAGDARDVPPMIVDHFEWMPEDNVRVQEAFQGLLDSLTVRELDPDEHPEPVPPPTP